MNTLQVVQMIPTNVTVSKDSHFLRWMALIFADFKMSLKSAQPCG